MSIIGTLLATIFIFFFFPVIILLVDRWVPLLFSIVLGDKSRLQDEILESGICEGKRAEWAPKPPPFRTMTPEERQEAWRREEEAWRNWEAVWGLVCKTKPPLEARPEPRPEAKPQSRMWHRRNELDDLADELRRELD